MKTFPSNHGTEQRLQVPRRSLPAFREGKFDVRFAQNDQDLECVLRLRYEVFNLELGEGLEESHASGMDRDEFDLACDHLMVIERASDALIGTYRMQTLDVARAGLYCDAEFDLQALPQAVLEQGVELGRACISRDHRHGHALFALWRGLAAYTRWTDTRYLYGCSSLTSQDSTEGWRLLYQLERDGYVDRSRFVATRPAFASTPPADEALVGDVGVPSLFGAYLRYGAKVCGGPALDRQFKTIDFLTVLDLESLPKRLSLLFFHGLPKPA